MKKIILNFLIIILAFSTAVGGSWAERPDKEFYDHPLVEIAESEREFARGKIKEILRPASPSRSGLLKVLVTSGPHAKEIVYARNFFRSPPSSLQEGVGENILISYLNGEEMKEVFVEDADRTGVLLILLLIFTILVALICGPKGLRSLFALGIGLLTIRFIFVPALSAGRPPVLYALLVTIIMVPVTMVAVGGKEVKSRAAVFGAFGGIAAVALLCLAFFRLSNISGFFMEEIQLFNYITGGKFGDRFFTRFLMAVVILGASGVIMDAAISVSSSLQELKRNHPFLSQKRFYESGLSVGGDIAATMVNTLITAYLGGTLGVILVKNLQTNSVMQLLNLPFFHFEIYRILLGACGFSAAVWLSVWLCSRLLVRDEDKRT